MFSDRFHISTFSTKGRLYFFDQFSGFVFSYLRNMFGVGRHRICCPEKRVKKLVKIHNLTSHKYAFNLFRNVHYAVCTITDLISTFKCFWHEFSASLIFFRQKFFVCKQKSNARSSECTCSLTEKSFITKVPANNATNQLFKMIIQDSDNSPANSFTFEFLQFSRLPVFRCPFLVFSYSDRRQ